MASVKQVPVVLLGCGLVGKAVLRGFAASNAEFTRRFNISINVVMVTESDAAVDGDIDPVALATYKDGTGTRLSDYSLHGYKGSVISAADGTDTALGLVTKGAVMIDCSATDKTTPLLRSWLAKGGGVVMANKKGLSGPMEDFADITSPENEPRARYESSVGAGTPFVASVTRCVKAGDKISSVEGTFSGTLGFLTAGLETGKSISELVTQAHELGYTEPDPRDDLSGMDVARKALILARTIGWSFEMSDVSVEALYPDSLSACSVDEFKAGMTVCNAAMEERNAKAKAEGCVLRYVASISEKELKVGMKAIPAESPIGRLQGTANIMNITSEHHPNGLVVQGAGAGDVITAAGVIADVVDIAQRT